MDESARTSPYVFLSYASADRTRALEIADRLEAAGIPVWIDRHSIEGGANWSEQIVTGIRGCAALVLLATPRSVASRNVRQEIQLAWEYDRPILPLLLEPTTYPEAIQYMLAGRQWVEMLDQAAEVWLPRAARALARLGLSGGSEAISASGNVVGSATPPEPHTPIAAPQAVTTEVARPAPRIDPLVASSPLSRLLARAPLVGRTVELDFLCEQYRAVAAGQGGRVVFLGGEQGAGKTRLAQEVGRYAVEVGGAFLSGYYLRDGTAAYGPWIEILRAGLRGRSEPEVADLVDPYRSDLARLLPELATDRDAPSALTVASPEEQQRRLFDGVARVVTGLAERWPLVVLLDDVQWAPGLSLLIHVARALGTARVLIVGTYRGQELSENPDLVRDRAELNRLRLLSDLTLKLLSEHETAELIGHYFGPAAASQLTTSVYRQTRGNAFFTEEVVRSLTEAGMVRAAEAGWEVVDPGRVAVPESMRLAVEERVARLGEGARDVLIQAAVLGQEFGFEALRALTARSEDELLDVVEQLEAARVLVDRSASGEERYGFLDDQIQEVLHDSIPSVRRRRFHLHAGKVIESVYANRLEGHLEELVRHFAEGNEPAGVARYAIQAAEWNQRLFQWPRVRHFYQQAVDALAHLDDTSDIRRQRVTILLKLVQAGFASVDPGQSLARLAEAETLVRSLDPRTALEADTKLAHVQLWKGRIQYFHGDYPAALESFERALAAAGAAGDREASLLSSRSIGTVLVLQGNPRRALPILAQALPLSRK